MRWDAATGLLEKILNPNDAHDWSGILWPGNATEVPSGIPLCGWAGELCAEPKKANTLLYVLLLVFVMLSFGIMAGLFWQYRYVNNKLILRLINF